MELSNDCASKGNDVNNERSCSKDFHPSYKIIIDTNGLLMPFQFRINLDKELNRLFGFWEILVPECVVVELQGLSKDMLKAKAALKLARNYSNVSTTKKGDEGVLEALVHENGILLSNDRELRKRALQLGYRVIYLRGYSHLEASMDI